MKVIVVLHNIRSTYNVGAILRSCDGFGVEKVILSGYTPRANDGMLPHLREKLTAAIAKTALGAEKTVPQENSENIAQTLLDFKNGGYQIIGLENNINDEKLVELKNIRAEIVYEKIALVLGEEVGGIAKDLYKYIDIFAEIPMRGNKESFNVSVAAGIALYELNR